MGANKRKVTEELLVDLLYETAKELLHRLRSGEATPQDISNIIKLLHNNDINVSINQSEIPAELLEPLPFQGTYTVSN